MHIGKASSKRLDIQHSIAVSALAKFCIKPLFNLG